MPADESNDDRTQSFVALTAGTTVAHYTIISKIGAGGMGEVYLADDTKLKRRVALKFIPSHFASDADIRARFSREAQATAKLDHPNIVPIYEVSEFNGRPFFAMAHIEGRSLREVIKGGKLTVSDAVEYAKQMCEGLHEAHSAGVVHRDVKPANIIIDKKNKPRILDFGLATITGEEKLTKTGSTLGTVGYMAPEQISGKGVDHRADLFSVGVIIYEMLTGRKPFEGDNDAAIVNAITNSSPEPIARFKSGVTEELQQVVDKALMKEPSLRYQHADGMLAELKRLDSGVAVSGQEQTKSRPSIAVLPFVNMSEDSGNEYFSDGLTEELMNVLVKIPDLHVAARTSVFHFKGQTGDIGSIGQQLNVTRVLEGSVRKAGNRVRITAQLIDCANGFHLWSEKYDRDLEDIFAVQDDIAQSVAKALKVVLLTDSGRTDEATAKEIEAYNLLLEGRYFLRLGQGEESLERALDCYQRAIKIDPELAQAWAGLSRVYGFLTGTGDLSESEGLKKAREAAERAVAIDDSIADAHCALGSVMQFQELNWQGANAEYQKALELEPSNTIAMQLAGGLAYATGRRDDAVSLMCRAVELDPLNAGLAVDFGYSLLCNGLLEEAEAACRRGLELNPARLGSHQVLGRVHLIQGRFESALHEMRKDQHEVLRLVGLALAYHALGQQEEADEALNEFLKCSTGWWYQVTEVYAFRGDLDKAFEWLERARTEHDTGLGQLIKTDPFLRNLHSDPRWNEFLAKIGLAD